jgi:hypothetical protein
VHKEATTQATPTDVEFGVDRVRGVTVEAPTRGDPGWLHVAVVGGSPPPPTGLAAAGDPYTLPLTSRATSAARRLARMVERHVQARGLPSQDDGVGSSSGVVLNPVGTPSPKRPYTTPTEPETGTDSGGGGDGDLVGQLRELADLHAAGALSDDEFQLAKDRLLG